MKSITQLRLEAQRVGDVAVLAAHGEIDIATAGDLETALEEARAGAATLVLDLRGLEFMDTSGLRLIFREHERAAAEGYRFAVVRGPAHVQRLFEIAGLSGMEHLFVDSPAEVSNRGLS